MPNFSLFKYSLKTSDSEILPYVGEYDDVCGTLFSQHKKKDNIVLNDSSKLDFEYAKYYGPLTVDTAVPSCSDRWNWINEPWPWQEGGC